MMMLSRNSILYYFITTILFFTTSIEARRKLSATSLVTCMQNSQITPQHFNVTFNPDDRSLRYALDLTTDISAKVSAHVQVYAYGFLIIEKDVDMCSIGWKQFCPIYPGALQVNSVEYISSTYTRMIPGIAYEVPDIDAVVKVIVRDQDSGVQLSCIQSSFSNGKTVSQTGVKWATAVIAGLGLLIAAILSTFGNSNAASHISANSVSLFLYFQSVVVVSMQAVERMPPIASAWAENLAWSMGLIRITFMQEIFRWYVQSTGGTPTTYFISEVKQILVQKRKRSEDYLWGQAGERSLDYVYGIGKRALDYALRPNKNLIILRGIKRIGYNTHIEPTSIVPTGYTWFILMGYVLVVALVLIKSCIVLLTRAKKVNPNNFTIFRGSFSNIVKGSILRYIYIGFTQLVIFSFWEFTQVDSAALVVLACLFILLIFGMIGWSLLKVLRIGHHSKKQFNNPAALLYGDNKILERYGFCYTMFHANKYWFGSVIIGYNLFKSVFIAFCQGSGGGKVSVWPVFIADLVYTIFLIWKSPYLNKPTNILNYMVAIVTTINSFLFLFFSDIFGQPAPVSSIMGWVFFILNAAFSLILLIFIIVLIVFSILSKNPDARFAPAKDDRFSFQRKSSVKNKTKSAMYAGGSGAAGYNGGAGGGAGELAALGIAAQDHSQDWESQMYKLNDVSKDGEDYNETSNSNSNSNLTPDHITPNRDYFQDDNILENASSVYSNDAKLAAAGATPAKNQSFGTKLKNTIARKLSKKSNKPTSTNEKGDHKNVSRVSDTLVNDTYYDDEDDVSSDEKRELNRQDQSQQLHHPIITRVSNPYLNNNSQYHQQHNNQHSRNESTTSQINNKYPTNTKDFL
ncbi:FLC1 [Candida pseudojiufengensis]|uniref:FLC1 n=1 Tax=Candida pseudojiufengensis TaxID=497109 RepID=UPI002224C999|nr:FLC1 [Candida pseudojiufengensis]KAI5959589.1 FLC1 [Candida pseudojiufengensis]